MWDEILENSLDALAKANGNVASAARLLKVSRTTLRGRLERAARIGYAPGAATPLENLPGFRTIKTTVEADAQGNVIREWRREVPAIEELDKIVECLCDAARGKARRLPKCPKIDNKKLCGEICVPDLHIAKRSWPPETGEEYTTSIACETAIQVVEELTNSMGPVEQGLLVYPGDFMHVDNRRAETETSGHPLDVDTRWSSAIDAAIRTLVSSVELMAQRARQLRLIIVPGNHDWHSALWLSRVLAAYYRKDVRVSVDLTPKCRRYYHHGKVLLGWAHGNGPSAKDWSNIMATEQAALWGETKYRYWHLGHIHRRKGLAPVTVDEQTGCAVEYLSALCAADAWHMEQGYVGTSRQAEAFLWHADHGPVARFIKRIA